MKYGYRTRSAPSASTFRNLIRRRHEDGIQLRISASRKKEEDSGHAEDKSNSDSGNDAYLLHHSYSPCAAGRRLAEHKQKGRRMGDASPLVCPLVFHPSLAPRSSRRTAGEYGCRGAEGQKFFHVPLLPHSSAALSDLDERFLFFLAQDHSLIEPAHHQL